MDFFFASILLREETRIIPLPFVRCISYTRYIGRQYVVFGLIRSTLLEHIISLCNLNSLLTKVNQLLSPHLHRWLVKLMHRFQFPFKLFVIPLLCQKHCLRCFKYSTSRSVCPGWFYMQTSHHLVPGYLNITSGLSRFRGKSVGLVMARVRVRVLSR